MVRGRLHRRATRRDSPGARARTAFAREPQHRNFEACRGPESARGRHEQQSESAAETGWLQGLRRKLREDRTFAWVTGIALALATIPPGILLLIWPHAIQNRTGGPYLGVFSVNFLAQFPVIPIPGVGSLGQAVIVRQAASSLTPWVVGLSGGLGMGFGEIPPYFLGNVGARLIEDKPDEEKGSLRRSVEKLTGFIEKVLHRWPVATIFLISAVPNPFLEVASISAGAARVPMKKYLPALVSGKVLRGNILAHIGRSLPFL
jgi:membrane protein DedA with SNARE-associated domain